MRIEVTAEDIARGKKNTGNRCPVAYATKRATGLSARVGTSFVVLEDENDFMFCVNYELPREVRTFINKFDRGRKVKPITFDLDITLPDQGTS